MKLKIKTPAIISKNGQFIPVTLYDELVIQIINERKIQIQKIKGYKIPTNDENPVYRTATALQKLRPSKFGAKISIKKNIPTFSGLNSQFSNAIFVLLALNRLWKFNLSKKDLHKIAKQIDPMMAKILNLFLKPAPIEKNVVLIQPKHIVIDKKWAKNRNILQYFPDLKETINILKKKGAEISSVSGKGSMLFGFFKKSVEKQGIKKIFNQKSDFIWVGRTCNKAVISDKLKS